MKKYKCPHCHRVIDGEQTFARHLKRQHKDPLREIHSHEVPNRDRSNRRERRW